MEFYNVDFYLLDYKTFREKKIRNIGSYTYGVESFECKIINKKSIIIENANFKYFIIYPIIIAILILFKAYFLLALSVIIGVIHLGVIIGELNEIIANRQMDIKTHNEKRLKIIRSIVKLKIVAVDEKVDIYVWDILRRNVTTKENTKGAFKKKIFLEYVE